jgi:uncharacterized protein Veg
MLFLLTAGGSKNLTLKLFPERKYRKKRNGCLLSLFENLFIVDTFRFLSPFRTHFTSVALNYVWVFIVACGSYRALRINCLY